MEKKKKILYLITQSELGGAQKYILDLVENLQADFDMYVAFGKTNKESELEKWLKPTGAVYYPIPHLRRAISPWHDFIALIEIIKLIRRIKPDIVHLNSSKISILGSLAAFLIRGFAIRGFASNSRIRIIYTAHGWVFNEPDRNKLFYKLAEKLTARFKDKIICVSEFDRTTAIKEKIAPKNKLITIHNGVDPIEFFSREEARNKLSQITNYPSLAQRSGAGKLQITNFIIGSIGNLYKTKGFEYLIDAIKLLRDNKKDVKLIIIGEGREKRALQDWISQNSLDRHIFLAGKVDKAARLLPAFDIYACSSVKEGLSYTVIEAMRAGLPIVATSVGGNPELIENEITGLLAEPQNPSGLATAIARLKSDKELREKISLAAREKSKKEFSLKTMIEKTKGIYLEK